MTTPTTPPPHRISDTPPVFPCWLYNNWNHIWSRWEPMDMWHAHEWTSRYTHWHPDQPEAPTARPEQAKSGYAWEQWSDQVAPKISLEGTTSQPAPTAAGTPRTDDMTKEANRMGDNDVVHADFARTLERELAAANLRADCLATDVKVWAKAHAVTLAKLTAWEQELSKAMPADFKDWHNNDRAEWPVVARMVIESLRERESATLAWLDREEDDRRKCDAMIEDVRAKLTAAEQQVASRQIERDALMQTTIKYQGEQQELRQQVAELGRERDGAAQHANSLFALTESLGYGASSEPPTEIIRRLLQAARRDTARIDWLEADCHQLVYNDTTPGVERGTDGKEFYGDTLRAAIDAAIHPSDAK